MKLIIQSFMIGSLIVMSSCKKDMAPDPECVEEISYATHVKPMLDMNCTTTSCHDAATAGGYNLVSHSSVSANAEVILSVISHESEFTAMPLGGAKFADSLIQNFNCWIKQGKLNN
ncbi:MAG: hypothetical protein QNK23_03335 [Crocinitomicaceae bacterium]|nr:hypothetical protein [Crocinitomicaceae bacterium]